MKTTKNKLLKSCFLAIALLPTPLFAQGAWSWSGVSSGTSQSLNGISMLNSSFGVAVGNNSTVLQWNGTAWSAIPGVSATNFDAATSLSSVSVINSSLVLIGGSTSTNVATTRGIGVWDGSTWAAKIDAGVGNPVTGIWTDRSGLIVTSRSFATRITRYNGTNTAPGIANNANWILPYNAGASTPSLTAINGASSSALFAAGITGTVLRSIDTGTTWTSISDANVSTGNWYSVASLSANQAWMGGVSSRIATWNGTNWANSVVLFGAASVIWKDIYALDANNVWAVGTAGAVKYWNGATWADVSIGAGTTNLTAIDYDGSAFWVTGENGAIFHAVPEPSTAVLILGGFMVFVGSRRCLRKYGQV